MILAIIQARYSSSRLPGKVLKHILGAPMLLRQVERVKRSRRIDLLVVATSTDSSDNEIEELCRRNQIKCFRGSLNDVLGRFYWAAKSFNPEHVVRLTGDCPLIDPVVIDEAIELHLKGCLDYTSNAIKRTYPNGLDVEVISFSCLENVHRKAYLPSHREHVTQYIHQHRRHFKLGNLINQIDLSNLRWTVDEAPDFLFIETIYEALYPANPEFTTADILRFLENRPDLQALNSMYKCNEGLEKSLLEDESYLKKRTRLQKVGSDMQSRYRRSEEMLGRALKVIPLGTQTFSKSKTQYPYGVFPYFIERGQGSRVWDVDGNEYIDFVNGLASITLGYNDPDVNAAVCNQLQKGSIFSLSHTLEIDVAEKIIEMVPCAEMVRFGKNGSDATAGAIRLARTYTGRDHVACCGYHGWQDWYIGSTARNPGVPQAVQNLTHPFSYNDIDSLEIIFSQWPRQVAAVIMEPMNLVEPQNGFLQKVKDIAAKHGSLLIFDETITGFRFSQGGAQEYFNVVPDLATFGKGLANGFPISAIAGGEEIMKYMEQIFFSFTFGGETLSLAASLATLTKLQKEPVIVSLYRQGQKIIDGVKELIQRHELSKIISIKGNPSWSFIEFMDISPYDQWQIKTLFLQEVFARGVLAIGTHNMSYAHSNDDISYLLKVYDEVFLIIKCVIGEKNLEEHLKCDPIKPLFKIR